jgi:hypothetical protein
MHAVLDRAIYGGIMLDQRSDGFYHHKIDGLRIPKIEIFPKSMKPQLKFWMKCKSLDSNEELFIKEAFEKTIQISDFNNDKKAIAIEGIPISMCQCLNGNISRFKIYSARMMISSTQKKCNYEGQLKRSFDFLLWHLKLCHKQLRNVQLSKGMNPFPEAEVEFNRWFYKLVLFHEEGNKITIFGDVDMRGINHEDLKYGPVQRFLIIEYFGATDSYQKVLQVSLALIGHWYQNFHPHFFFQREQEYWKKMFESLGSILELRVSYSSSRFDDDVKLDLSRSIP